MELYEPRGPVRVAVAFILAAVVAGALWALVLFGGGCAENSRERPFIAPNGMTPGGVPYVVSWWAEGFRPALEAEIDAAAQGETGYVVVAMPGTFETPASPTGRANGLTDPNLGIIYVAWRSSGEGLYLPALTHEYDHVRCYRESGDPDPLHQGCMVGK